MGCRKENKRSGELCLGFLCTAPLYRHMKLVDNFYNNLHENCSVCYKHILFILGLMQLYPVYLYTNTYFLQGSSTIFFKFIFSSCCSAKTTFRYTMREQNSYTIECRIKQAIRNGIYSKEGISTYCNSRFICLANK